MKTHEIEHLITSFQEKKTFSARDLYDYFLLIEGEINESTLGWRIYDLKKKKTLQEIKSGWYTLAVKPVYTPTPDKHLIRIDHIIQKNFREVNYCVWNLDWLNEFTVHQFSRDTFVVEIERDLQESLGYTLHKNGFKDIIWSNKGTRMSFLDPKDPIFLLPLISRAPVQLVSDGKKRFITCPLLEKILVDIYEDDKIFHFIQGAELDKIFEHALTRYAINLSTLFGYAKRRNKGANLQEFLNNKFPHLLTNSIV